jgi:hypothetical protein
LKENPAPPESSPLESTVPVRVPRVCFLYIAEAHQLFHSLSIATELARSRPDISVELAFTRRSNLEYARQVTRSLGGTPLAWRLLGPSWLRRISLGDSLPPKLPMLVANLAALSHYDVIVTPERTTAAIRSFGEHKPRLVYTQHGAGDREGPFEPRLRSFDLVFAAGRKQRDRMVGEGLVAPERCAVVGYPKFDLVEQLSAATPRLFGQPGPIVLYNPHFHPRLSSWPRWGPAVLRAFADQDRYNLIFAPHVRLFGGRPAARIGALKPYLDHPRIHLETGRATEAFDMTFTRLADLYLGDVSSQVYEFIREPRPCLFLNAAGADWQADESYRHWRFGPVLDDVDTLLADVEAAFASQGDYRDEELAGFRYTFDVSAAPASRRAAEAIAHLALGSATSRAHDSG